MTKQSKNNQVKPENNSKEKILVSAKAPKLNPKSKGSVYFEIRVNEKVISIRITKNDGGGLHSKEWIPVKEILEVLDAVKEPDKLFTSSVFKPIFASGSANNVSFLAAILRSKEVALIAAVPSKMYSHQLNVNYTENKKKLLALAAKS